MPEAGSVSLEHPTPSTLGYADWVSGEVEAQNWDDVRLVGHSMGGAIAQLIGMRRPPWLCGLVLSSTAAQLRMPAEFIHLLETDYPAAVDLFIEMAFAQPPGRYRREGVRRQMLRVPQTVSLADYRACDRFDRRAALRAGALRVPTLVICGEKDVIVPPADSLALADGISGAVFRTIPAAGHMAPVEQAEAWADAVLSFEF